VFKPKYHKKEKKKIIIENSHENPASLENLYGSPGTQQYVWKVFYIKKIFRSKVYIPCSSPGFQDQWEENPTWGYRERGLSTCPGDSPICLVALGISSA
jgi:hypothetical protein